MSHFQTSLLLLLAVAPCWGLPPSDSQCGGYSYTSALIIQRSGDMLSVSAQSTIGGFNPCSFATSITITSPGGSRNASAQETYNASLAQATATLPIQTEGGVYSTASSYGVHDDTDYPDVFFTPNSKTEQISISDPTPLISAISPDIWPNGERTDFEITGTGFGTSPALSISGAGIVDFGIKPGATDTWIPAYVVVDGDAPGTPATVTVTSNGYTGAFLPSQPSQPRQSAKPSGVAKLDSPTLSDCPSTITRGGTGNCTVTNLRNGRRLSWTFTYDGGIVTGPTNSTTASWPGTLVAGGTVIVKIEGFQTPRERAITVSPRAWSTSPVQAQHIPGNTIMTDSGQPITLPTPPQAGANDDAGLGQFYLRIPVPAFHYYTIGSGPNQGFTYFDSPANTSSDSFTYIVNTQLDPGNNSEFSRRQCGSPPIIASSR